MEYTTFRMLTTHKWRGIHAVYLLTACGTPNRGGRVVGGEETAPNEYPWMVAFYYSGKLYCSGSLVNDRYIITAAHCVRR